MSIKALGLDTSSHGLDILSRGLTVLCRGFDILSRDFAISSCGFCTLSCYLYISSQDLNIILTSWRTIKTEIYQVRMSLTGQYIIYIYIYLNPLIDCIVVFSDISNETAKNGSEPFLKRDRTFTWNGCLRNSCKT